MNHSPQTFNIALEEYVFKVASKLIDSVDPSAQSALVDLAGRFATVSTPEGNAADLPDSLPMEPQPWQEVLSHPVDWRSVHREWVISRVKGQQQQQQKFIAYLEEVVNHTQQQHQQIQNTVTREPHRSNLLKRNQQLLTCSHRCLANAQAAERFNASWLERLQLPVT